MIKKTVILILTLALLLSAAGCSLYEGEISDLFQPPRLGEEQQAVLDALKTAAGGEYTLKHPLTGSNRSSVVFADMDGDGEAEAAAFFVLGGMATVQLQFFDSVDGVWNPITLINGDCSEVYRCEFADLDGDGAYELAVGWDISLNEPTHNSESSSKGLSIYGFSEDGYKQLFSTPYSYMLKVNLNSDASDEIAIIATTTTEEAETVTQETNFSVIESVNGAITAERTAQLYNGVMSYVSLISGKIGDGQPAVLLDARLNTGEYVTQIIQYNGDGLALYFSDIANNPTRRTSSICCMDIDQDTTIEFPVCSPLPDYDEDSPTVRYLTDWCTFENGVFATDQSTIVSTSYGFYITVYEENRNIITAEVDPEQALFTIRIANGKLTGEPLFCIKRFSEDSGAEAAAEGYTILFKSGGYMITAKLIAETFKGRTLTMDEIKEIVHPLSIS
ncbi:MAG: hypothetical protein IKS88_03800 [Clostridia bacterium]|nr:hypothetical protein [Clostridia bacterium]